MKYKNIIIGVIGVIILIAILMKFQSCNKRDISKQNIDIAKQTVIDSMKHIQVVIADSLEKRHQDTIKLIVKKADSSDKAKDAEISRIKAQSAQKDIAIAELSIKAKFGGNSTIKYDTVTKKVEVDTGFIKDYNIMAAEYDKTKDDLDYANQKFDECQESNAQCDTAQSNLKAELVAKDKINHDQSKIIRDEQHNNFIGKIFGGIKTVVIVGAGVAILILTHVLK